MFYTLKSPIISRKTISTLFEFAGFFFMLLAVTSPEIFPKNIGFFLFQNLLLRTNISSKH